MIQQKKLTELNIGEEFTLFLMVNKSELKIAKNGRSFLSIELRDSSLNLPAKIWDNAESYSRKIVEGEVCKVAGQLEEYNGAPQIKIEKIRVAEDKDGVVTDDFLPKSIRPIETMINELDQLIASMKDPSIKQLLETIFSGENFKKYLRTPAGKSWHHSYIHGLLEHTLEIVKICDLMCTFHQEINRDILIAGALLHDYGKTEELIYDSVFDYSDKGKLLGHIVIGAIAVEKSISSIPGFPEQTKNELLHLILSHQGKLEYASPVEPKTLEAIVLYQADELSAKTNAYKSAIEAEKGKGSSWTKFLPLANTSLYIPQDEIE